MGARQDECRFHRVQFENRGFLSNNNYRSVTKHQEISGFQENLVISTPNAFDNALIHVATDVSRTVQSIRWVIRKLKRI